jgi:predicted nucleic acid-binding protein
VSGDSDLLELHAYRGIHMVTANEFLHILKKTRT